MLVDCVRRFAEDIDLSSLVAMKAAGESGDKERILAALNGLGQPAADRFTIGVELLRSSKNPCEPVRSLAAYGYDAIHHREVVTMMDTSATVRTLAAIGAIKTGETAAQYGVIVPALWLQMAVGVPACQLAAIVYTLSQAVDMAHGRLLPPHSERTPHLVARGRAFEAAFWRTLRSETMLTCGARPDRILDEIGEALGEPGYVMDLLKECPDDPSLKPFLYTRKPLRSNQ